MIPLSYGTIYKTPDDHKPPDETELADNTDYPNLNSRDYAKRPLNRAVRMHDAWECISINTPHTEVAGNIAICTNKLSGREWTGTLWGFEKTEVAKAKEATDVDLSCFKLQSPAVINCMEFVGSNILVLAFNTGRVQVWSTRSEVRNSKNPYCLFLIGEKCEHMKPITCLTGFKVNSHKAVTGSKDGALKIWDMGSADLFSLQSYRFAHTDSITGLASLPSSDAIFATCSLDKSCLLWDERETRPAIALYENHNVRFKNICWSLDSTENSLYMGDESGYVLTVDKRNPKEVINKIQYFDRPIRKISPNGDNLAVIADSNYVKVSKTSTHSIFYENSETQNFIRDCAWLSSTQLLTVGFEGKLRSHDIK